MKTKFLCLSLVVMMMLTILTGCTSSTGSLDEIAEEAARGTQTLVVYLMSEIEISEQTASDVEDEINRLTKAKYKTQLDLRFFTEEQYYSELEKKFKDKETEIKKAEKELNEKRKIEKALRESCKAAGISYVPATTEAPDTAITEAATLVNPEYGTIEYVYPEAEENQLDFFYLGGYDRYMDYIDNEWIAPLDEELATSSKTLKQHIPSVFMDNLNTGGVYGIPNSSAIGEYTWMLLDKELMDKYFFTESSITSIYDENLSRFLGDVSKFEEDVLPIKGDVSPVNIYYWSINSENNRLTNEFSILASSYTNLSDVGYQLEVHSLFHDARFRSQALAIKGFEEKGFFGTEEQQNDESVRFAMSVVEGGYEVYAENCEDYYIKMLACPRADKYDIFESMLCVNALEDNVSRSMEIITYINTNEDLRNILQYGVEGENYYIDDDGVLHRYNETYMMDINKTGNVFMAHPEEDLPENYWDYGIQQNEDAKLIPTFGFELDYDTLVSAEEMNALQALSEEYMARMEACTTVAELETFFGNAIRELAANEDYVFVKNDAFEQTKADDIIPIHTLYVEWLKSEGYIKDEIIEY